MTTNTVHPKPTARLMTVTPKLASEWLGKNRKNRNLRPALVSRYARDMKAGRWEVTGESVKFNTDGHLTDGQHRLAAILQANTSVDLFVVRDLNGHSQDFMDTGARRTTADMLKLNGKQNATELAAAVRFAMNWQAGNIKTSASTLTLTPTHSETLAFVGTDARIEWAATRARHFYDNGLRSIKPSVLAFCLWIMADEDASAANTFFQSMADMTTDGPGDPRYALLRRLHSMKDEKATQVFQATAVLKAWQAWRKGEKLSKVNAAGHGKPTPFPVQP